MPMRDHLRVHRQGMDLVPGPVGQARHLTGVEAEAKQEAERQPEKEEPV
jgi:hypothetical protein